MSRSGPVVALLLSCCLHLEAPAQQSGVSPPGRLVDLGGYRLHVWCSGPSVDNRPTVVLSPGGGDFATDWSLVQVALR